MIYNVNDIYIGRSLHEYAEFSEGEVEVFLQAVKPGQVVLEVGANIGAHTVWFAKAVGPSGAVMAFEPQRLVFQTLFANIAINSLPNVHCLNVAVSSSPGQLHVPVLDARIENNFGGIGLGSYTSGEIVPVITIDGMNISRCNFLKIDVEGMELDVLKGAAKTIARLMPVLYVENDRPEKSDELIRYIDSLGYNLYWHRPPYFNPDNYAGNTENIFGNLVSLNMLCVPKEFAQQLDGFENVELPASK